MIKHILREVPSEQADLSFYFDDDCFNERAGAYGYTLFIVSRSRFGLNGLNIDEYKRVKAQADELIENFQWMEDGKSDCNGDEYTARQALIDTGIEYSPEKCAALCEWYDSDPDTDEPETIAAFLTILTGKTWETQQVNSYYDYVDIIYCPEYYPENVQKYGEIWLGAAKEFCVIEVDETGEETDSCYGYIVADSECWKDEDYKQLVCNQAGINPEETRLEMIDGYHTYTKYEYRAV